MNFAEISLRDEWDCIFEFVRNPDGRIQKDVMDIKQAIWEREFKTKRSEETIAKYLRADGVFTKPSIPPSFGADVAAFRHWMENLPEYDAEAYARHEEQFHWKVSTAGQSPFAFIGREDELQAIHAAFKKERRPGQQAVSGSSRVGRSLRAVVIHGGGVKNTRHPAQYSRDAEYPRYDVEDAGAENTLTARGSAKSTAIVHRYRADPMLEGVTTLKGFGGQGKTSLAREYTARYRNDYNGIIWLDAAKDNIETALLGFVQTHLREAVNRSSEKEQISRFGHYLSEIVRQIRGRVLIVVDDVPAASPDESEDSRKLSSVFKLLQAVPPQADGRIDFLLTSRKEFHAKRIKNMTVNRLNAIDAANLFRGRAEQPDLDAHDPLLQRLVDQILGGHALSITLLASLAREEKISDLSALIQMVEGRIVEGGGVLETIGLGEEYERSLSATLSLVYAAISPTAKYLLMLFGLFRRVELTIETIRFCSQQMPEEFTGAATELIRLELGRSAGRYKAINSLVAHGLVERIDYGKGKLGRVRLHEVIYDFVQATWGMVLSGTDSQEIDTLRDLELALTHGACIYASDRINQETIEFVDIETLIGFLLPIIRRDRGIVPAWTRVHTALEFWFEHFKFQNLIYDTGLQHSILAQAEDLHAYLVAEQCTDERFFLVLKKIIAHGHYADPLGEGGKIASTYFDEALELARAIENKSEYASQRWEIQWYKIFLLDHRATLASKKRSEREQLNDIRTDPALRSDLDEIEATLPAALKSMEGPLLEKDCELLVRAGIYWGHRGNQDNYVLYRRLIENDLRADWSQIVSDAHYFYKFAVHLRLMTLWIFRHLDFKHYLEPLLDLGKIPYTVPWLKTLYHLGREGFEVYTSLSQAIGDTAHQYRHYHFVSTIAFFAEPDTSRRRAIFDDAKVALDAADLLWALSANRLGDGEVVLIYRTWMASSYVLHQFMESVMDGVALAPLNTYLDEVVFRVKTIEEGAKASYTFSVEQQLEQVARIYDVAQAV